MRRLGGRDAIPQGGELGEFLGSFNNLAPPFPRTRIEEDYIPWINILTRGPQWDPGRAGRGRERKQEGQREREAERGGGKKGNKLRAELLNHSRSRPYNRARRGIIITTGNPPIRNT